MTFWSIHIPSDQLKDIIKFGGIVIGSLFGLRILTWYISTIMK
ncbi:MAG: hypothetical protein ACW9W3_06375 [Candidatus Nitrosopumilus sp. bin_68KS]